MAKFGLLKIESVQWNSVSSAVSSLLEEKGKQNADKEAKYCEWYEGDPKGRSGQVAIKQLIPIKFITRKRIEETDLLTEEVYRSFNTKIKNIAFCSNDYFNDGNSTDIFLILQDGASKAISDINSKLDLKVSTRRRVSFTEDFLEFLNTSDSSDPLYDKVFGEDMQSIRRKAKKGGHTLSEGYMDLGERDKISEEFREAAGVKITPPANLYQSMTTMEVIVYKNDWVSVIRPKMEEGESIFYEALLYSYERLQKAFIAFQS